MQTQTLIALPNKSGQRGYALIGTIALIGIASTAFLVTSLSSTALKNQQGRQTAAALAMAKQGLIGYAASHENSDGKFIPGWLPCPDVNNDGIADGLASSCINPTDPNMPVIGRLPWRTLGLPDLRDSSGERLWYAVSNNFKNDGSVPPLSLPFSGAPSSPLLVINDGNGQLSEAAAIVFAPGTAINGQERPLDDVAKIGDAANYLDSYTTTTEPLKVINNAAAGPEFVAAKSSEEFNDQLIYITPAQLTPIVQKIVGRKVVEALKIYEEHASLPAPIDDRLPVLTFDPARINEDVAYSNASKILGADGWFQNNGWNARVVYAETAEDGSAKTSITVGNEKVEFSPSTTPVDSY